VFVFLAIGEGVADFLGRGSAGGHDIIIMWLFAASAFSATRFSFRSRTALLAIPAVSSRNDLRVASTIAFSSAPRSSPLSWSGHRCGRATG
jgi:hypothetical protein